VRNTIMVAGLASFGRLDDMKPIRWISGAVLLALLSLAGLGCAGSTNADVEAVDPSTLPPQQAIFEVAARGDVSAMESLVESDPSLINARNEEGRTPLHFAAGNDAQAMVDFLLDNGADPLAEDVNSEIPADAARQEGYLDMANYLMDGNLQDSSGKNNHGETVTDVP